MRVELTTDDEGRPPAGLKPVKPTGTYPLPRNTCPLPRDEGAGTPSLSPLQRKGSRTGEGGKSLLDCEDGVYMTLQFFLGDGADHLVYGLAVLED